ncbi:hydroxypyruvate isomerase [Anseongella ginsenosidimutans]|uniref:Hydroxypyruvate isomerase n=1 Tax=Anseongella ginsenosidimutans TaxID=496056 RepID=A0A4R3KRR1_9SPHI|nr:TIM barrel protein [Anseongella ginsenosidimutans]QEC53097.1 TIM barrel protein [Anseongella ginsenosidimutans]TCS87714.1 hydroxypyruvate isomerase [Anseongella ginsenosidimutans]
MKRRSFVKGLAAGSAVAGLSGMASAAGTTRSMPQKHNFKLKYAPHFGMFEHHAGKDPIDQLHFMAETGFMALEDNGMMGRPAELQTKIGDTLAKLGMTMGVFVVDKGGNSANTLAAGKKEHVDIFLDGCRRAVEVAKRCNAKWMTVVPGDYERHLPLGIQTANVIEALRRGAEILEPHGLVMVLEPLSDSPNLFLQYSDQTYLICKAVNSPSCKILYDAYHLQKNEGQLITNIERCWEEIPYFQIGDNPGRKEPTTGEINYRNVFKYIHEKGYTGVMGMEHGLSKPGKEGELALIQAYVESDNF